MKKRLFGLTVLECRHLAFQLAELNGCVHSFNKDLELSEKDWMQGFLRRHPDVSNRTPEATSRARAMDFNRVAVGQFFKLLTETVEKHHLTADKIYNSDETGITINPKGLSRILVTKGKRQVGALTSRERDEMVTVEICFSAAGA
ncbi:hypothetical protein ILUMI_19456 [Ignelater luminosus]|uniref:Transposase n=1 Tax=Ignelater luminosus TaxID=2038154 RepID=A0A8K0CMD6_IGNLU|nr:hypothetical protein ILUMI_19456 [Ignelater luminosus]